MHALRQTLTPGTTLGDRFEILRALGSGSFGHTFLARDSQRAEPVALKLLNLDGHDDWKSHELFAREATVLRSLHHHGVPEIFDATDVEWQGRRVPVLVMEYIEGASLLEHIETRQSQPTEFVVRLTSDLLSVIEYLHERMPPVLHRDIKPANVIVRPEGSPVLVDFGSVRHVFRAADETGSTIAGTYGYMPYEQYMGQATPSSDLFSLGATLLHLITGRPPREFMDANGQLVVPAGVTSSTSLQHVLARMLRSSPQDRFASARDARTALLTSGESTVVGRDAASSTAVTHQESRRGATLQTLAAARLPDPVIPHEVDFDAPRLLDVPQKELAKRLSPSMFAYMDTSAKSTDPATIVDGIAFVAISLLTLGVYPAMFFTIARGRRKRVRRFIRSGTPAFARIHRIDSEGSAFGARMARVHYEFEVNGALHRDSDQVLPLLAGRWEISQCIAILYIPNVPYDSVIISES
ncbi:MAG: serine/threonine protein kinase [Gemmatimonas sp.]